MKTKSLALIVLGIAVLGGVFLLKGNNNKEDLNSGAPIQSHRSYTINSDSAGKNYAANTSNQYSFSIVDERGDTLKDFAVTHTKQMHVIVVRKDLANFQHVHPEFNADSGRFTLKDLTFPAEGDYRIFADFAAEGGQKDSMGMPLAITLSEDVKVGTSYIQAPLGTEEKSKTFGGMQVNLMTHSALKAGEEAMVMFNLSQGGKPVTDLQEYLGALGHAVVLREGNLDFIHAHPMEDSISNQNGTVSFMINFPEAGRYKIFTQFQRAGKVITTDFVVSVEEGSSTAAPGIPGMDMSMPGMEH